MKTYLCPECGRELKRGQKCPKCGKPAQDEHIERELRSSVPRGRNKLFKE